MDEGYGTTPDDGHKYYAYMLLHMDDCVCIHHDASAQLKRLEKFFKMKPVSIGDLDMHLGAKVKTTRLAEVLLHGDFPQQVYPRSSMEC